MIILTVVSWLDHDYFVDINLFVLLNRRQSLVTIVWLSCRQVLTKLFYWQQLSAVWGNNGLIFWLQWTLVFFATHKFLPDSFPSPLEKSGLMLNIFLIGFEIFPVMELAIILKVTSNRPVTSRKFELMVCWKVLVIPHWNFWRASIHDSPWDWIVFGSWLDLNWVILECSLAGIGLYWAPD